MPVERSLVPSNAYPRGVPQPRPMPAGHQASAALDPEELTQMATMIRRLTARRPPPSSAHTAVHQLLTTPVSPHGRDTRCLIEVLAFLRQRYRPTPG